MRTQTLRAFALALLLTAGLTGCYKSAGGKLEPTQVGNANVTQVLSSNTQIPMPTSTQAATEAVTVEPTQEQATALPSPLPSSTPTQGPTSTATFRPAPTRAVSEQSAGQGGQNVTQVAIAPTFTQQAAVVASPIPTTQVPLPTSTATFRPAPTQAPLPTLTPFPTQPPVVGPTMTFTPFPQEGVPIAERATETQAVSEGQGGFMAPLPTFTPYYVPTGTDAPTATVGVTQVAAVPTQTPAAVGQVPSATPNLTVNQMTATAIITNVTATAAWLQGTREAPVQPVQPGQPTAMPGVIVTATPGVFPTAAPAGQCGSYLIQPGDTMSRIALSYNVTTQQLAQANNISNPDLILAGNTLIIPCPTAAPATAVPNTAGQGGATTTTTTGQSVYIVEPGDNIYRLSVRFGVSMADLMRVNGLSASTMNTIYAGQELIIPPGGAVTTTTTQPGTVVQPTPGQVVQPTPFQQTQPQQQVVPAG